MALRLAADSGAKDTFARIGRPLRRSGGPLHQRGGAAGPGAARFDNLAKTVVADEDDNDDVRATMLTALAHNREDADEPTIEVARKITASEKRSPQLKAAAREYLQRPAFRRDGPAGRAGRPAARRVQCVRRAGLQQPAACCGPNVSRIRRGGSAGRRGAVRRRGAAHRAESGRRRRSSGDPRLDRGRTPISRTTTTGTPQPPWHDAPVDLGEPSTALCEVLAALRVQPSVEPGLLVGPGAAGRGGSGLGWTGPAGLRRDDRGAAAPSRDRHLPARGGGSGDHRTR